MNLFPLLLLVPLVGAAVCAVAPAKQARGIALFFSLVALLVSILMAWRFFDPVLGTAVDSGDWDGGSLPIGVSFTLGVDGISVWLVLLTTILTPLAIAASFASIRERESEYYGWMLVLLMAMVGVFLAKDVLLFYVFFELTLVPMFFIIGIWGGPERRFAAAKFFLFTFAGSVFTLAALVYVGLQAGRGNTASFAIDDVVRFAQVGLSPHQRFWVVMGLLAGFAVKVPLFPVHTWLPLAHTEAPTAGSVILAGVLLKLGTYGLIRLAVPIGLIGKVNPDGAPGAAFPLLIWWIGLICVIGVIYGALAAWVQQDIKKLVAYSSVSHLGFCVLGLAALNSIGLQGSVLYMINHGISTGALFLMVGMIYDRYHTRDINALSGLARRMPILASFFILFTLASIGLPGTNGFVSEFLTILGAFISPHLGIMFGSLAALGIILGAVYMLHMVARVIFGPLKTPDLAAGHGHGDAHGHGGTGEQPQTPRDINGREIAILVPLALAVIILGVRPGIVTGPILDPVEKILQAVKAPLPAVPSTQPSIAPLPATVRFPGPTPSATSVEAASRRLNSSAGTPLLLKSVLSKTRPAPIASLTPAFSSISTVERLSPSPGTPGEGGGEGLFSSSKQRPHPSPLPESTCAYGSPAKHEKREDKHVSACHPERSEGSLLSGTKRPFAALRVTAIAVSSIFIAAPESTRNRDLIFKAVPGEGE